MKIKYTIKPFVRVDLGEAGVRDLPNPNDLTARDLLTPRGATSLQVIYKIYGEDSLVPVAVDDSAPVLRAAKSHYPVDIDTANEMNCEDAKKPVTQTVDLTSDCIYVRTPKCPKQVIGHRKDLSPTITIDDEGFSLHEQYSGTIFLPLKHTDPQNPAMKPFRITKDIQISPDYIIGTPSLACKYIEQNTIVQEDLSGKRFVKLPSGVIKTYDPKKHRVIPKEQINYVYQNAIRHPLGTRLKQKLITFCKLFEKEICES